jgi:hypothetical protein
MSKRVVIIRTGSIRHLQTACAMKIDGHAAAVPSGERVVQPRVRYIPRLDKSKAMPNAEYRVEGTQE